MGFSDEEKKTTRPSFSFEEEEPNAKTVVVVYGRKGDGKTTTAFSFPGVKAVISFDNKSVIVKDNYYDKDQNIHVWDGTKYLAPHPDTYTETSDLTIDYLKELSKKVAELKPDWVIIDGLEIFSQIAEMAMRKRQGLRPFQGVQNLNVWKERNIIIRDIHMLYSKIATKGMIYTTYATEEELIKDGVVTSRTQVPKWQDAALWISDIVIFAYSESSKEGRKFYAEIVSSKKDKMLKTGTTIDMTGRKSIR